MQKIKSLFAVVLFCSIASCAPKYVEPLAQQTSKEPTVRLRSEAPINDKKPIIVVDGKIVPHETLLTMDPDDIASINVLKGASAAAIYGARSKNGVVLITMKK